MINCSISHSLTGAGWLWPVAAQDVAQAANPHNLPGSNLGNDTAPAGHGFGPAAGFASASAPINPPSSELVNAAESARAALEMEPPCQRVTLVPDAPLGAEDWTAIRRMPGAERVRELPSGPLNPGRKRNVAMESNAADVFGFVDADARTFPD